MARIRRTARNEPAQVPKEETTRPEIVVTDPEPKPHPDQVWTLTSYPFYEPAQRP